MFWPSILRRMSRISHRLPLKETKQIWLKMIHYPLVSGERGSGAAAESASHGPLLQNQGPRQCPDSSRAPRAKCKTSSYNKQRFLRCQAHPILISLLWLKCSSPRAGRKQIPFPPCALMLEDWPIRGQIGSGLTNQSLSSWVLDVLVANDVGLSLNWGPHKNAIIPLIMRSHFSVSKSCDNFKLKINPDGFISLLTFPKICPD